MMVQLTAHQVVALFVQDSSGDLPGSQASKPATPESGWQAPAAAGCSAKEKVERSFAQNFTSLWRNLVK